MTGTQARLNVFFFLVARAGSLLARAEALEFQGSRKLV